MSRFSRLISVTALAGLALAGAASSASARAVPEQHKPSYWESYEGGTYECTKVEFADGVKEYTAPWDVAFVVIKAGQTYKTLAAGESITLRHAVSFVITCVGEDGGYEEPEPTYS